MPPTSTIEQGFTPAAMLDLMPEPVNRYRVDDHVITYCNSAWAALYGIDPCSAVGTCLDDFLSPDEMAGLDSQLALLGPDNSTITDCAPRKILGRSDRWIEWVDRYLTSEDGAEILSVGRDVTDRRIAEMRLQESEARFRELADNSSDIVWRIVLLPRPHIDYVSPSVVTVLGYAPDHFTADFARVVDITDRTSSGILERALAGVPGPTRFDLRLRHQDGSIVIGETNIVVTDSGLQGVIRDVTELRRLQATMAEMAQRDPLTGLANRWLFDELLAAELARTEAIGAPLAIAFVDLDRLKRINDQYGHAAGDLVITESAQRLRDVAGSSHVVARLGGDEFALVFDPTEPAHGDLVRRLDERLSSPIAISPWNTVKCSASIGVADTREAGHRADDLLAAADQAMYAVKLARRTARRFMI